MTVPVLTHHWPGLLRYLGSGDRPGIIPLGCSVGVPRSLAWARKLRASELTPWAMVGKNAADLTPDAWKAKYLDRLERHGVDKIRARFEDVYASYGERPIVLLCWEADPARCHRSYFAEWWFEQTGERVPETHGLDPLSLLAALGECAL